MRTSFNILLSGVSHRSMGCFVAALLVLAIGAPVVNAQEVGAEERASRLVRMHAEDLQQNVRSVVDTSNDRGELILRELSDRHHALDELRDAAGRTLTAVPTYFPLYPTSPWPQDSTRRLRLDDTLTGTLEPGQRHPSLVANWSPQEAK